MTDFTLPELGENVAAGDVLRILVKPGDTLAKDQPILELETDKATIEVPSSVAGRITDIKVKVGDKVSVGQSILSVEDGGAPQQAAAPEERKAGAKPAAATPAQPAVKAVATAPADGDAADTDLDTAAPRMRAGGGPGPDKVVDINRGSRAAAEPAPAPSDAPSAPAAPSVRRMARELGVDVNQVTGTGDGGRISIDDVKAHAKRLVTGAAGGGGTGVESVPLPDFSRWGDVEREPMRGVRRKTAEHLSHAWATVPHVTQNDLADITALEELRRRYAEQAEASGGNLTVTAIAVKVCAAALRKFRQVNASIDARAGEIVFKKYVNIGVAVDTDRGLLVPVIRNADQKNIIQIAAELAQLSEKARNRKIALDEMQGGCFSVSNLGGIGGTYFTPIVNAPEVAILGISRASMQPKWVQGERGQGQATGEFVPRLMLPLSLSYDHRVIDGADGIRFLRWVVEALEQPFVLALHG